MRIHLWPECFQFRFADKLIIPGLEHFLFTDIFYPVAVKKIDYRPEQYTRYRVEPPPAPEGRGIVNTSEVISAVRNRSSLFDIISNNVYRPGGRFRYSTCALGRYSSTRYRIPFNFYWKDWFGILKKSNVLKLILSVFCSGCKLSPTGWSPVFAEKFAVYKHLRRTGFSIAEILMY